MAMPPGAYEATSLHARLCAQYHAQVEIVERTEFGDVHAIVKRLFRGKGTLRPGDEVRFQLPVLREGGRPRPGPSRWMALDTLMAARYLEVFFHRARGRCAIDREQYFVIPNLTDKPSVRVPPKLAVALVWWWMLGERSMPSCDPTEEVAEDEVVVELRDQDGARTSSPGQFRGWLEVMKPGDSLTFVHKDGGQLLVKGAANGPFLVQYADAQGQILEETPSVTSSLVCDIILKYMRGDAPVVITKANPWWRFW
jgi:hypothetical protein